MTIIQRSKNSSIESPELTEIPLIDWLAERERLFGDDKKQWKWKCPNCGHVQSIADFIELKKLGIIKAETDVGTLVYYSCIGRFDTRILEKDVGTIWDKKKRSPCNYTN
ncbi:MAG: VVA0879 family protein, partial [Solirubrobacteraceae bacterium]|nr:VVA0879 family protein [Solirubrobacteraceae bacterium]